MGGCVFRQNGGAHSEARVRGLKTDLAAGETADGDDHFDCLRMK